MGDLAQVAAVRAHGEDLGAVVGVAVERDQAVVAGERGVRRRGRGEGDEPRDEGRGERHSATAMIGWHGGSLDGWTAGWGTAAPTSAGVRTDCAPSDPDGVAPGRWARCS